MLSSFSFVSLAWKMIILVAKEHLLFEIKRTEHPQKEKVSPSSPWVLDRGSVPFAPSALQMCGSPRDLHEMRHSMAKDQGSALAGKLHHTRQQELNWPTMTNTWFCGLPGCDYLSIAHLTLLRSMRIQFFSPKSIAFSAVFPFALPPTLEEKW